MSRRYCTARRALVSVAPWFVFALPAFAAELRVGAAAVRITPPTGIPMAGYYSERRAEGALDELHAKALVFEQDGARAALLRNSIC